MDMQDFYTEDWRKFWRFRSNKEMIGLEVIKCNIYQINKCVDGWMYILWMHGLLDRLFYFKNNILICQ